jgi:tetraacyldisaccharide 4'-kinase
MTLFKYLLWPFSQLYATLLWLRNRMYDMGILKSQKVDISTIVIGNVALGGTGKTPHARYFLNALKSTENVALLSRGYGRKSKGFHQVVDTASAEMVGDEPLEIKRNLPEIPVFVCEKRVEGVEKIHNLFPKTQWVVLDDAFQHRALKGDIHILLTEWKRPYFKDFVLPMGTLRDHPGEAKRADIIIFTKCPEHLSEAQMKEARSQLTGIEPGRVFFSKMVYKKAVWISEKKITLDAESQVLGLAGIAHPHYFESHLSKIYNLKKFKTYPDHHAFSADDIQVIRREFDTFDGSSKAVLTTEKDAMRLLHTDLIYDIPVGYIPLDIEFIGSNNQPLVVLRDLMRRIK